jgi:thioredoxin 1
MSIVSVENDCDLTAILQKEDRIIALFYASWCPFCKAFLPVFERHAAAGRNFVGVKDDEEAIAERYAVEIYPTVIYFENGKVTKRLDGKPGAGLKEQDISAFIAACALP